jgi:outer membrane protein assembly factor BamB
VRFRFPEASPFALICGIKESNDAINPLKNDYQGSAASAGNVFCTINHRPGTAATPSGSFSVSADITHKGNIREALERENNLLIREIESWKEQQMNFEKKEHEQKIQNVNGMIQKIVLINRNWQDKEPAHLCVEAGQQTDVAKYHEVKRLRLGSVGTFCSSPVELSLNRYLTTCDGENGSGNEKSGKYVIFNKDLSILFSVGLKSTLGRTSVSSDNVPLVRKSSDHKFRDVVLSTKDGRVLFIGNDGRQLRHVKFDYDYLGNPKLVQPNVLALLAYENAFMDKQRLYYFSDAGIIRKIELGEGDSFHGPYLFNENIYLSSLSGRVLGFNSEGIKILDSLIEKKARLSPIAFHQNHLLVGTDQGKLYQLDPQTGEKQLFYQARYSGVMSYSLSENKMVPLVPDMIFAPVILNNGHIAVATANDGRIHFLNQSGELIRVVDAPHVGGILNFSAIDGTNLLIAGSISNKTLYDEDGLVKASYSNAGAENFFTPLSLGNNRFFNGMFNGIFLFQLMPGGNMKEIKSYILCE